MALVAQGHPDLLVVEGRCRAGSTPRRNARAAVEPVRRHPWGPPGRLAWAVQLL